MIKTTDTEALANEAAGNWQKFDSFSWWGADHTLIPDPENWMLYYTSNRDSDLLEESNAAAIAAELKTFTRGSQPTVISQSHNHWLVGHVDGYAIRVRFPSGKITKAFGKVCEIKERLENYPVLDDEDYSRRGYEATLENIAGQRTSIDDPSYTVLPDGWEAKVFDWLWENDEKEVYDSDDRGGYPSTDAIFRALVGCGILPDPDTYPADGLDLVTIDLHNFFVSGRGDRGLAFWVPEGRDWRPYARRYIEESGETETCCWRLTGNDIADCELIDHEE